MTRHRNGSRPSPVWELLRTASGYRWAAWTVLIYANIALVEWLVDSPSSVARLAVIALAGAPGIAFAWTLCFVAGRKAVPRTTSLVDEPEVTAEP